MAGNERTVIDFRKRNYFRVTKQVVDDESKLTKPVEIAVYTVLCMYANNDSKDSHPSVKTIANKARCSETVARRSLRKLKEAGYIDVIKRYGNEGKQTSNQYALLDVND